MKKIVIYAVVFVITGSVSAEGNIERGKQKAGTCIACHGVAGNSVNPAWPKLAGSDSAFIKRHLQYFKQGQRVNALMSAQAKGLSDQDIEDLAVYYASVERSPGAADEKLVDLGKSIYKGGNAETGVAACIACHGPKGSGNPAAGYPKISFQHAMYSATRLKAYRSASETYPQALIMNSLAKNLTNKEIEAVSSYIQGLH